MQNGKIGFDKIQIGDLFKNYWFEIPNYQRHYVWETDDVYKLLDDVNMHHKINKNKEINAKDEYFLGSLVLQKKKSDIEFDVLDGQQRLTTLLLVISVIRDLTVNDYNRDEYVKEPANPDKRIPSDKNRINFEIRDNVKDFCNKYVYAYDKNIDIENKYNEIKGYVNSKNISLRNMSNALITIKDYFKNFSREEIGEFFATLINDVILIYVSTENREDAFRLFTILNSRGVPLSNADILKSINLGAIKDNETQENYAQKWQEIEDSFGKDDFDRFLSHIRAIYVKQKARATLLNEFENVIYDKEKPLLNKGIETINTIEKYSNIYNKIILLDSTDENGCQNELSNEYKNLINILKTAFSSTDWIPPLLAYYNKFKDERILEFLKKMEEKALCDIICRESTTRRMDSFYKIIELIDKSNSPADILYASDNAITNSNKSNAISILKTEGIYGRNFDKYLLLRYEYKNLDDTAVVSDYSNLSIEHVLPQTPNDNSQWLKDFTELEREKWTHNIANLIIISGRKNSSLSNLDFSDKKEKLAHKIKDVFKGSSEILKENEWTTKTLENRLQNMIDKLFD